MVEKKKTSDQAQYGKVEGKEDAWFVGPRWKRGGKGSLGRNPAMRKKYLA